MCGMCMQCSALQLRTPKDSCMQFSLKSMYDCITPSIRAHNRSYCASLCTHMLLLLLLMLQPLYSCLHWLHMSGNALAKSALCA